MFLDFVGAALACLALSKANVPSVHGETHACENRHPSVEMKEGWNALRANRGLFLLIVLITPGMVSFGPMGSLYSLMTYGSFGGDGFIAAVAEAAFAGGLFVVSLVIMAGEAVGVSLCSWPPRVWRSGCWQLRRACSRHRCSGRSLRLGMVCSWFNGPTVTLVQRNAPEEKMGRALGFVTAAMGLATPIGIAVGGVAADAIGVASFSWSTASSACLSELLFTCREASVRLMNRLSNSRNTVAGWSGSIGSQSEAVRFRPLCIDGAQGGSLHPPESACAFSGL